MKKTDISKLTDNELIRLEFNRRFAFQDLPTEPLNLVLDQETAGQRQVHYRRVAEFFVDPVIVREIQDWKRRLMRQLALGTVNVEGNIREMTDLEKQGWRQALIEIEREVEVLRDRALRKENVKPLRPASTKI